MAEYSSAFEPYMTEKVACIGCEAPILAETAARTDGFCMPCYRTGVRSAPPAEYRRDRRVAVNPENWSEESKRSYIFDSPPREYRDKLFSCDGCGNRDVFNAVEQREVFEVQKSYIWKLHTLCKACWIKCSNNEQKIRGFRKRWQLERTALLHDETFQREWLESLEAVSSYGRRRDSGNIAMLRRLLAKAEPS